MKIARVAVIPNCDICRLESVTTPAKYDAATTMGSWAFLCQAHFSEFGIGLGTGVGQELKLQHGMSDNKVEN